MRIGRWTNFVRNPVVPIKSQDTLAGPISGLCFIKVQTMILLVTILYEERKSPFHKYISRVFEYISY